MSLIEEIKELRKDVGDVKVTLAINTQSLQDHMRRTEILEDRFSPGKIVAIIATITGTVLAIVKIYVTLGGR